jgi:hypothetical protein
MAKLHQLLAVDASQKGQAAKCRTELQTTLEKKRHLFEEKRVTFTSSAEGAQPVTEAQSDIQSSVRQEVEWLNKILVKAFDAAYSIDKANTLANADIVLDGHTIAKGVPATALLQLEHRLKEVKEFIGTIPTLDPAKGFTPDDAKGVGIYKAREVRKTRTSKEVVPLILAPATDKHPAQVDKITKDVPTGTILEQEWSALITPALKAELLERAEDMYRAVATARSKANDQEIDTKEVKIGAALLDYIYQPLLK